LSHRRELHFNTVTVADDISSLHDQLCQQTFEKNAAFGVLTAITESYCLPKCDTTVSNINTDVSEQHATYILTENPEDGSKVATKRQYLSFPNTWQRTHSVTLWQFAKSVSFFD
jgi:hypothetical protein